eukprot:3065749-Rhodomonas_salina.1
MCYASTGQRVGPNRAAYAMPVPDSALHARREIAAHLGPAAPPPGSSIAYLSTGQRVAGA